MAYKRSLLPVSYAVGEALTSDLIAIGMRLGGVPSADEPNIEDTIVAASIEGLFQADYRVLSLLVDWFGIHVARVNVDRLTRLVAALDDVRVKAFWVGLAQWQKKDSRLKKLQQVPTKFKRGHRFDLMSEGTDFQIERYGEDPRFIGTVLKVPSKLLRHRPQDIASVAELAKRHLAYSYRIMIGPSYRADMWALVERKPELTPTEIARQTYGSFPTAWEVKRDWLLLNNPPQFATAA